MHPSVADIPEHELVDALLADSSSRSSFAAIHGMPRSPVALKRVLLRDAPGNFVGDIDILLFNQSEPERAVAIEVKRIKVGPKAFLTNKPNKLSEIQKAKEQANYLAQVGFAQVYLYLIIVIDSRANNAGEVTYRGMTTQLRATVDDAISEHGLVTRAGFVVLDFIQPMDHPPLTTGSAGGNLKRLATEVSQDPEITRWIGGLSLANAV